MGRFDFSFDEDDAARLTFSEISAARFAHVMRAETTVISTTAEGSGFFTRYIYNDTNNIAYLVLDHDSGERQIEVISPGEVVENDFSPFACSMYYSFTEPQA